MQIGERLRRERKRLRLSQAEFSQAAGVSAKSQFNYETGINPPDANYLVAIRELGVDVLHVLFGDRAFAPQQPLPPDEALLLQLWRQSTASRRVKALAILGGHGREVEEPTAAAPSVRNKQRSTSGDNTFTTTTSTTRKR